MENITEFKKPFLFISVITKNNKEKNLETHCQPISVEKKYSKSILNHYDFKDQLNKSYEMTYGKFISELNKNTSITHYGFRNRNELPTNNQCQSSFIIEKKVPFSSIYPSFFNNNIRLSSPILNKTKETETKTNNQTQYNFSDMLNQVLGSHKPLKIYEKKNWTHYKKIVRGYSFFPELKRKSRVEYKNTKKIEHPQHELNMNAKSSDKIIERKSASQLNNRKFKQISKSVITIPNASKFGINGDNNKSIFVPLGLKTIEKNSKIKNVTLTLKNILNNKVLHSKARNQQRPICNHKLEIRIPRTSLERLKKPGKQMQRIEINIWKPY